MKCEREKKFKNVLKELFILKKFIAILTVTALIVVGYYIYQPDISQKLNEVKNYLHLSELIDGIDSSQLLPDFSDSLESANISFDDQKYYTVTLEKVVDGDTIVVNKDGSNIKVRLIGVDTPESVSANESENCIEGEEASEYTKSLLNDVETMYITYDTEYRDKYERELCYLWLSDDFLDLDNMLNYILVKDGYAQTMIILPNDKYATELKKAENIAKKNSAGLWNTGCFD